MAGMASNSSGRAMISAVGVVVAGIGPIVGFWFCFTSLAGRGDLFDPERDLMLFGPYALSAINILVAPASRAIRWLAVVLLGIGLGMGSLVLVELVLAIRQGGRPPDMFGSVFLGAFALVGQYFASAGCLLGLSVAWLGSFGSRPPATEQTEDYAD